MTDKSILLVEDNPDDAALTVRAFNSDHAHPNILVARDGTEALQCLLGSDGQPPGSLPALVLLDLKLPGIDGFEVLRRIRTDPRTRLLPVVILTSSTEPADLTNGYALGANSYVRKPMSYRDLLKATQQIAEYWLLLNQLPPRVM